MSSDQTPDPTPEKPLLTLRDGLPPVVETRAALTEVCERIAAGTGPVAIDAERASGYRYSSRAYLIQLRREGAGTFLVDPIAFDSLAELQEALDGTEWILHAATQDLPCLAEVGLTPNSLFDTELAGRLLGYPRVGLATLVESLLGYRLAKEHSAVDWSTRPLPAPWLEYAALDVEVLVELRAIIADALVEAGKDEWARQEFEHLRGFEQPTRVDAWRRTSGMHKVRGRRGLAAVRELWETRDAIAEQRDVTPGRILPDSAIVVAAQAMPTDKAALMSTKGFHGRGADRYAARWVAAIRRAAARASWRADSAISDTTAVSGEPLNPVSNTCSSMPRRADKNRRHLARPSTARAPGTAAARTRRPASRSQSARSPPASAAIPGGRPAAARAGCRGSAATGSIR